MKVLEDNAALRQKLAGYNLGKLEFINFKTAEGVELNASDDQARPTSTRPKNTPC